MLNDSGVTWDGNKLQLTTNVTGAAIGTLSGFSSFGGRAYIGNTVNYNNTIAGGIGLRDVNGWFASLSHSNGVWYTLNSGIYMGTGAGTVVGTQTSDKRLKTHIEDIDYGLNEVLKLRPVRYKMKATGNIELGFIAQETQDIIPESVYNTQETRNIDGQEEIDLLAMDYSRITPVLVKAIKQLNQRIEALENGK